MEDEEWNTLRKNVPLLTRPNRNLIKDSIRFVMNRLYKRGNECTEELLFLRSLAFRLSQDEQTKSRIDESLYELSRNIHSDEEAVSRLKQTIFRLFKLGLDGLCSEETREILTKKNDKKKKEHKQFKQLVNMFIVAILEAYSTKHKKAFNEDLFTTFKRNQNNFDSNCRFLKSIIELYGINGIELTAGCHLED
jgi:hypothetical protein